MYGKYILLYYTYVKFDRKFHTNHIFFILRKGSYGKRKKQYNQFNQVIKHNGYCIYEF